MAGWVDQSLGFAWIRLDIFELLNCDDVGDSNLVMCRNSCARWVSQYFGLRFYNLAGSLTISTLLIGVDISRRICFHFMYHNPRAQANIYILPQKNLKSNEVSPGYLSSSHIITMLYRVLWKATSRKLPDVLILPIFRHKDVPENHRRGQQAQRVNHMSFNNLAAPPHLYKPSPSRSFHLFLLTPSFIPHHNFRLIAYFLTSFFLSNNKQQLQHHSHVGLYSQRYLQGCWG